MILRKKSLTSALLVMLLTAFSVPLLAQHSHGNMGSPGRQPDMKKQEKRQGLINVGRTGEMKVASAIRVGQTLLNPGTYKFQHVIDGADHVVIFKQNGDEVARVTCRLEPLDKKAKKTALSTHVSDTGETILDAVEVRGENVKHVI